MADSFVRRFKRRHFRYGIFSPEAFQCTEDEIGLSLHKRDPPLDTVSGLAAYQVAFAYPSGDRLGVSELGPYCFKGMQPPVKSPPGEIEPYSELHYELRPCPEDEQAAQLAACAQVLIPFVKV